MSELSRMLVERQWNAVLSWLFIGVLWGIAVENMLGMSVLWAGFVSTVAVLVMIPALAYRDTTVMLPWEVVLVASLPIYGVSFDVIVAGMPIVSSSAMTYVAAAAAALIVAVELHIFTDVQMTPRFAVLFVVLATLAASGVWTVVQWLSDSYLGTSFLHTNRALMQRFLVATAAGISSGIVFDRYFRRRRDNRLRAQYREVAA